MLHSSDIPQKNSLRHQSSQKSSVRVHPTTPPPLLITRSSQHQSSIRRRLTPIVVNNDNVREEDVPVATKAWVIRVACGQIVHALDNISDTLSDQLLQELCAELVVRSSAVIQSKIDKSDRPSNDNLPSMRIELNREDHRKAETVGKRMSYSRPLPVVNAPEEDLFTMFPNNDDVQSYHALYNYNLSVNQRLDYLAFKRSDTNVSFILFFYLSAFFFMITGFFWSNDVVIYQRHPTATISIIFVVLAATILLWIGLNHMVSLSGRYKRLVYFQWYYRYVVKLYKSSYGQWPDNCASLFAALASGFYLVNVVIMNLCHTTSNISNNIECLPTTVPPEAMIMTMLIVIMVQIVARGVSHIAIVCSWVICLVAINFTIYLSGNSNYVWINLLLTLLMGISYELERQPLRQFINTAIAREAAKVAAELALQLSIYKTLLASEALESKRSLVRHIGHEIRTPLNVVGVGIDILIKELEPYAAALPDGVMDIIEGIQEASSASLEVINELLEFEKLAAGMTTLERVPTPILPFLEQAMKQHLLPARAKEILFELVPSVETRSVTVNVDPCKLTTVFKNIFSNAIKFTKLQGRVTIRVYIKRLEGIEMLEIAVIDSGAGLSPANIGRLFGEGVQFNANGLQGGGGSGLGLFITKGIIELHEDAKIWAESEGEGKGCTFFVRVPVHSHRALDISPRDLGSVISIEPMSLFLVDPIDELTQIDLTSTRQLALVASSLTQCLSEKHSDKRQSPRLPLVAPVVPVVAVGWKPTILVVDDSSMNRKMLVRSLVKRGFACCEAEDGLEALSEMLRSSNQTTRKLPSPILSIGGSIVSPDDAAMAGGGAGSPHSPHSPGTPGFLPRGSGSRMKLIGVACTNMLVSSQIQHFSIDAVLIDFHMPKMNGPEAIVELRNMGFRGPIIGVSGGDEKSMKQFLEAGADNVILKPAKTDMLVDILLTGLEMVVVFDETQQRKATAVPSVNREKDSDVEIVRKEHMDHLLKFLTETKAKAQAKARGVVVPIHVPILVPVIIPVIDSVIAPSP